MISFSKIKNLLWCEEIDFEGIIIELILLSNKINYWPQHQQNTIESQHLG